MRRLLHTKFALWLQKRIPAGREQSLTHQKIFIFPSRFGIWFLLLCLLLFILGTNYQNNLMKLLCTFLLSVFLLHLFTSYINFSRLKIKALTASPSYAGSSGQLPVWIGYQHKKAQGIVHLSWWQQSDTEHIEVPLSEQENTAAMPFKFEKRGIHRLNRLTLRCDYPLGLFKCWTHLDLDQQVTVYPKLQTCKIQLEQQLHLQDDESITSHKGGNDEFYGFKDFDNSDTLSRVAWKQAAKSEKWQVKTFEQQRSTSGWLSLASSNNRQIESQLSDLSYQIVALSNENRTFGLSLPGVELKPQSGEKHKHNCLLALATYPSNISTRLL